MTSGRQSATGVTALTQDYTTERDGAHEQLADRDDSHVRDVFGLPAVASSRRHGRASECFYH
jgi:hypothetical protein